MSQKPRRNTDSKTSALRELEKSRRADIRRVKQADRRQELEDEANAYPRRHPNRHE